MHLQEILYFNIFQNLSSMFRLHVNWTGMTNTLHESQYFFLIISRSFLLSIRNVSDKSCRENQNTKFIFNNFFFRKSCPLWDNTEKYITAGQATDDNMALKHCMLVRTATNTQSMKYFWFIHSYISFTKALCLHYLPCYILQSKEPHKQFWWTLCTKTFGLEHCSLDMLLCDCDEFG